MMVQNTATAARVNHEWVEQLPLDLYVPPDAFEVLLDHFEGPLDFLLYLVKKSGVNLLQIDIAPIAAQYLRYIDQMRQHNIELAAEYLVMAALLADLKSRLLLPKPEAAPAMEEDTRLSLLARLEAYAQTKQAAAHLDACQIRERDYFDINVNWGEAVTAPHETHDPQLLFEAFLLTISHQKIPATHTIAGEIIDLGTKMADIRDTFKQFTQRSFYQLLNMTQGRMGMAVTFMAVLELIRLGELHIGYDGMGEQALLLKVS